MSTQVTTAMIDAFSEQVIQIAQDRGSKLENAVLKEAKKGERVSKDRLGTVELVQKASRHADTPFTEIPHTRRWATPVPFEGSELIDEADDVRVIAEFENAYAVSFGMAMGRRQDLTVIQAANGIATTGRDASGTQAFLATQRVLVGDHTYDSGAGDVGLTVGKLIFAKRILVNNGVDEMDPMGELHAVIDGTQLGHLLASTEIASIDFNKVKALIDGDVDTFMGIKFHKFASGILAADGALDTQVLVWAKSAMWLNEPIAKQIEVDRLPTKSYSTQIFAKVMLGSVRLDDAKVVEILCDPT